jgi:large subunit ribosomal protein L33
MAKSKDKIKVILRSSESHHFYTTTKNKRNKTKLVKKKYDPMIRRHTEYNEEKMK